MTNRQELKEKIIKELLPNLSVDPRGTYVDAKELSKQNYEDYSDYYFRCLPAINIDSESVLDKEDYQEIYRAMIEDIKQHKDEWKIEQEGKLEILKHSSGKKHYQKGFEKEEWQEIEQVLNQQETNPTQSLPVSQLEQQTSPQDGGQQYSTEAKVEQPPKTSFLPFRGE